MSFNIKESVFCTFISDNGTVQKESRASPSKQIVHLHPENQNIPFRSDWVYRIDLSLPLARIQSCLSLGVSQQKLHSSSNTSHKMMKK